MAGPGRARPGRPRPAPRRRRAAARAPRRRDSAWPGRGAGALLPLLLLVAAVRAQADYEYSGDYDYDYDYEYEYTATTSDYSYEYSGDYDYEYEYEYEYADYAAGNPGPALPTPAGPTVQEPFPQPSFPGPARPSLPTFTPQPAFTPAVPAAWYDDGIPTGYEYLLNRVALPGLGGAFVKAPVEAKAAPDDALDAVWANLTGSPPFGPQRTPSNVRATPPSAADAVRVAFDFCEAPASRWWVMCEPLDGGGGGGPEAAFVVRGDDCSVSTFEVEFDGLRPGATYACGVASVGPLGLSPVSARAYPTAGMAPLAADGDGRVRSQDADGAVAAAEGLYTTLRGRCPVRELDRQPAPQIPQAWLAEVEGRVSLAWHYCTAWAAAFRVRCGVPGTGEYVEDAVPAVCWRKQLQYQLPIPPTLAAGRDLAGLECQVAAEGPFGESAWSEAVPVAEAYSDRFEAIDYCAYEDAQVVAAGVLEGDAARLVEGCTDVPPDDRYTCAEQKEFGKCDEAFMVAGGFCRSTCGGVCE